MDELFKLLVVPLIGGFLYICANYRARHLLLPAGGEKFFLACGAIGAIGLIVSTIGAHALKALLEYCPVPWVHDIHREWHQWMPFSFAQVLALLGLPLLGRWQNKKDGRREAYAWAVSTSGDSLEMFFEDASEKNKLIALSLHSGRVYVGKIEELVKPVIGRRHIKIIPFMSGFRHPLTTMVDTSDKTRAPNRIHWSTTYREIVSGIIWIGRESEAGRGQPLMIQIPSAFGATVEVDAREMGIVISVEEIETATLFNPRIYAYLNRDRYPFVLEKMTKILKMKREADGQVSPEPGQRPGG